MKKQKRVIIETQSNKLFRGVEAEQDYDQRGGLCQVEEGDVIVVTNPIDRAYLAYWKDLGFTLPKIIEAGPFDETRTLADLIMAKQDVQKEIKAAVGDADARLEFFWIEESERQLAAVLGISPYCTFDVSIPLSCKHAFKRTCEAIGLPTAPWIGGRTPEDLIEASRSFFSIGNSVLVKASNGTGGISLGGIRKVSTHEELVADLPYIKKMHAPLVAEKMVDKAAEVSIHWEMKEDGGVVIVDIFDQLAENFSYAGTAYPSELDPMIKEKIKHDLIEILAPYLRAHNAKGYFCCDLMIDRNGNAYWTDLNPRKGAIMYVHDMARRLAKKHFADESGYFFWHEHFSTGKEGLGFSDVRTTLRDLLCPTKERPFVVVTNPGVIRHGGLDITGFSLRSRNEAHDVAHQAKRRFV